PRPSPSQAVVSRKRRRSVPYQPSEPQANRQGPDGWGRRKLANEPGRERQVMLEHWPSARQERLLSRQRRGSDTPLAEPRPPNYTVISPHRALRGRLGGSMKRRQYRNPPIEEAICELRFTPGPEAEFTAPARFYESIKSSYPGKPQYQQFVAAGIQVPAQPMTAQVALRQEGVKTLFPSQDGRRLVGLGMNLLSIHELKPYSGWEDFRSRIEQAIRAYQNAAAPIGV